MRRYLSFCMLGIATMLASCSQNEELLQGAENNSSNSVTFSVALDEGMKTRAYTEDPGVSEMKLQAILLEEPATGQDEPTPKDITAITSNEDGTFAVTVSGMMTNSKYKLVLWADNGSDYTVTNHVATPADKSKPGIAFYGTSGDYQTPDELSASASETLELTHAVTKVTLNTTTTLTNGKTATLSVPTYTSFNLISGEASGEGIATDASEGVTSGDLCSVYVLCNDDDELPTATIELSNGQKKEIASLPMKRNNHIKLQGDVDGIRTEGTLDFNVYLEKDWNEDNVLNVNGYTIALSEAGTLTSAMLDKALGYGNIVAVSGDMNENDMKTVFSWLKGDGTATAALTDNEKGIDIDLSGATATDFIYIGTTGFETGNPTYELTLYDATDEAKLRLRSIIFPEGIKEIGSYTFGSCKNLRSVTLPQSLETLSDAPFYNTGITEIDLPSNVTLANLMSTPELKTVNIKGNVESFNGWDLRYCTSLTDIYFYSNTTAPSSVPGSVQGETGMFDGVDKSQVTIHIPAGTSVDDWKAGETFWDSFNFKNDIVTE